MRRANTAAGPMRHRPSLDLDALGSRGLDLIRNMSRNLDSLMHTSRSISLDNFLDALPSAGLGAGPEQVVSDGKASGRFGVKRNVEDENEGQTGEER